MHGGGSGSGGSGSGGSGSGGSCGGGGGSGSRPCCCCRVCFDDGFSLLVFGSKRIDEIHQRVRGGLPLC